MRIVGSRQALALLGLVWLVGCGGGSSSAPAATPTTPADPGAAPGEPADEGVPVGDPGTVGHGAGPGSGQGFGSGHGRLGGSHRAKPPQVRMGATQVSGRLPPEVIQRIVRQNFGRFRLCYEQDLRTQPSLAQRVTVSFTIGRDGSVTRASGTADGGAPQSTASCVARAFSGISFPEPEGGVVNVTYPLVFSPG